MNWTLPILTFHVIDDGSSPLCFPPQQFKRAMGRLAEEGYRTLRLAEVAEQMRNGQELPPRSVVLTFDDGDRSVYEQAWPVLRQYGMTATVFILPTEPPAVAGDVARRFMGRPLISWQQVEQMHQSGIEFGAHTLNHPDLTRLPVQQIEMEICRSKRAIEDVLHQPVSCFAYPYGRHDDRCRSIVSQHFACACSDALGLIGRRSNLYALERVDSYYLRHGRMFDLIFTRKFSWYLRGRDIPRRIRRMIFPPRIVDSR